MKLRLQSNSIRLRLKRGEVDELAKVGRVEEKIVLGSGDEDVLSYAIESSSKIFAPLANLQRNRVLVQVPVTTVAHWASGDDVAIETRISIGSGRELLVLIEKDLACLNGDEEKNRDTFPNPLAGTKC